MYQRVARRTAANPYLQPTRVLAKRLLKRGCLTMTASIEITANNCKHIEGLNDIGALFAVKLRVGQVVYLAMKCHN
jgi:hypothetical protein